MVQRLGSYVIKSLTCIISKPRICPTARNWLQAFALDRVKIPGSKLVGWDVLAPMGRQPTGIANGYLDDKAPSVAVKLEGDQINSLMQTAEMREGAPKPSAA